MEYVNFGNEAYRDNGSILLGDEKERDPHKYIYIINK